MKKVFVLILLSICNLCVFSQGVYIFHDNKVTTVKGTRMEAVYVTDDKLNLTLMQRDSTTIDIAKNSIDSLVFYYERDIAISKDGLGPFSVGENDTIYFAPGNLQYKPSTEQFRFSTHQWDYVGDAENGNVYEYGIKCNNNRISKNYDGWIDLFTWGTGNKPYLNDDSKKNDPVFYDWGDNKIEDFPEKTWRTITYNELEYLLFQRTNAAQLAAFGIVNGFQGLILLPDGWNLEKYPIAPYSAGAYVDATMQDNIFGIEQWKNMEERGAVFLVGETFRGLRSITNHAGESAGYWHNDEEHQQKNKLFCFVSINETDFGLGSSAGKVFQIFGWGMGAAVRLVREK